MVNVVVDVVVVAANEETLLMNLNPFAAPSGSLVRKQAEIRAGFFNPEKKSLKQLTRSPELFA